MNKNAVCICTVSHEQNRLPIEWPKLITKEKFETNTWNYFTPRSVEKAINQIGWGLSSEYDTLLMPYLTQTLPAPIDIKEINIKKGGEVAYLEVLKLIVSKTNEFKEETPKKRMVKIKVTQQMKN